MYFLKKKQTLSLHYLDYESHVLLCHLSFGVHFYYNWTSDNLYFYF
jgi:hypothetical protein